MANIKISQLPNINANLTPGALIPVVSVNGNFTTDKISITNLANYILTQSGNLFISTNISNLAYNVINAAQPNITSVGTLTGLTVVGTSNIGYPNNVVILGGTAGQVLSTFGDGSLGWIDQVGATGATGPAGDPGGATGATGQTGATGVGGTGATGATGPAGTNGSDGATGATGLQGDTGATGLQGDTGATGPQGDIGATGIDGATGASGPGFVWQGAWQPIPTTYVGGQDVVSYAGSSYIKIGDGNSGSAPPDDPIRWSVMAEEGAVGAVGATGATGPAGSNGNDGATGATGPQGDTGATGPAGGGANTGNVTFDNINIIGTGNLHLQPDPANSGSYLDIFLTSGPDLHLVASAAANLILGQDAGPNVMTSWDGNVYIQSWNTGSNTQGGVWNFGEDGLLTLPGSNTKIGLQYGSEAILANNTSFGVATQGNGTTFINWSDDVSNTSMLAAIYVNDPSGNAGNISVRTGSVGNANVWKFVTDGSVIFPTLTVDLHNGGNQTAQTLQFGDPNQQAIITGPTPALNDNAQRLIIQGQRGNGTGEGGDVYFWAGDADTNGGDIKIYAGDADSGTGSGGYINIDAGNGPDSGGQLSLSGGGSSNGQGGTVNISAGGGGTDGGAVNIYGGGAGTNQGGNIALTGGYGGNNGGEVRLTGGSAGTGLPGYGNVVLVSGASTWTFDNTGTLTVPQNIHGNGALQLQGLANGNTTINIGSGVGGDIDMVSNLGDINLYTANNQPWIFDQAGNLTAPGAINVGNMYIGAFPGYITATNNTGVTFNVTGSDGGFAVNYLKEEGNANTSGGELAFNSELGNATYRISLSDDLGDGFATKIWRFDGTGNLTLPGNTFAVNYANGTQVSLGGGGGNTGNVTFNDQVVQGTGDEYGGSGLYLAPGTNSTANLQFLRVRGGDYPTHIHLDTGNNNYFDQYFGADFKFVKLEANGNIVINADDDNGNSATWILDYNGNLILANGNSVIRSVANSSLDPLNPNVSTMILTPDANYSGQALVLDPTAPGHIHLRSPAYGSNIDDPVANLFLGGEQTAFEVTQGANSVARIHSGNLTWTFSNNSGASVIDLPGESYIRSNQDTVNIQSLDANGIGRGIYIGTNGTLYFWDGNSQSVSIQQDNTNANITAIGNASITSNVYTWTFGEDGNLTLPGTPGRFIKGPAGGYAALAVVDDGTDLPAQLVSINSNSGTGTTAISAYANNAQIQANINGDIKGWVFDNTGNLTLPGNTFAVNYANGTQVSLGGGTPAGSNNEIQFNSNGAFGASGNYTFTDTVGGGSVEVGNELLLLGNGTISTASNNLNIQPAGNLVVTASAYNWTFDIAGNLTLPSNTFNINFANGSQASAPLVDVLNTNGLTTVFYPTFVENRTDGQIVRADVDLSYRSDTNTLTVGNITASGNITATNLTLNGQQITASGIVNASYLFAINNADQNGIAANNPVEFQTTQANNGSLINKISNTQVTLTGNNTYRLEGIIKRNSSNSTWSQFQWYDVTNGVYVGGPGFGEAVTSSQAGVSSTIVATAYVTPSTNTTYELRSTVNTVSVQQNLASMEITQINPAILLSAITNLTTTGNVDVGGSLLVNGNVAVNGPAFSAYQASTGTALNSGGSVKLNFDAEDFDTNNNFNLTNDRFTPTVAGYYQVTVSTMIPNSSLYVSSSIYKNGSKVCDGQAGTGGGSFYGQSIASKLIYMNGTTDYLEAYAIATGSVTTFPSASGVGTYFQASMVRGA